MGTLVPQGGVEVESSLELVLGLLETYASYETHDPSARASCAENDLALGDPMRRTHETRLLGQNSADAGPRWRRR